ncbi:hypothetical protein [Amycolatopsis orientalis]|uniref:hypothetical protein n=1 Tax=Amycolatopsis orientalis TaxID=31958 RepID=UPI00041892FE|nr:hypothetical protein [Amycolatopsis orientalis]
MRVLLDPDDDLTVTDVLRDVLATHDIPLARLATAIGRNVSHLHQIVKVGAPISVSYADAVARYCGLDPLVLLARQARSDIDDLRRQGTPDAGARVAHPAPALIPRYAGGELDDEATALELLAAIVTDSGLGRKRFGMSFGFHASMMYKVLGGHRNITPTLAHKVSQRSGIDPVDLLVRRDRRQLDEIATRQETPASPPRPSLPPIPRLSDGQLDHDTIIRRYTYGFTSHALGHATGTDAETILRILHARDITTRGAFSHPREPSTQQPGSCAAGLCTADQPTFTSG